MTPIPTSAPAKSGFPKLLLFIPVAFVALIVIGVCVASGSHSGGNLKLTADARGFHPSSVGEEGGEDIAVTNNDTDIGDLVIFYANGDNWLDHHVATDLGGCTIDKGQDLFRCGPLAAGQTRTILIRGTAKDRGNYNYRWGLGDGGSNFRQWGTDFTWSEAIT